MSGKCIQNLWSFIPDLFSTSHLSSRSSWRKFFRCQPFEPVEPKNSMYRPSVRSKLVITSPNAPFPITLSVLKSCRLSLVLRSRRNVDSFFPRWCICRCFLSDDMAPSPCSRRSSSTRLYTELQRIALTIHARPRTLYSVVSQILRQPCSSVRALTGHPLPGEPHH